MKNRLIVLLTLTTAIASGQAFSIPSLVKPGDTGFVSGELIYPLSELVPLPAEDEAEAARSAPPAAARALPSSSGKTARHTASRGRHRTARITRS